MISLSPLPSVHPKTFQRLLVRTSRQCYPSFILTKGRSQSFASTPTDYAPFSDSLSLRLQTFRPLTSPVTVTRRLIMQKARCHSISELQPLVSVWFQVLFSPSCSEYFSPFLHSTGSLSVSQEYLALPDGAGNFKRGVSNPAILRILPLPSTFSYGAITRCGPVSHPVQICLGFDYVVLLPPTSRNLSGLGSCAFARHYLRNHCCFLLLQVLRCFSSLGLLPIARIIPLHGTGFPHSDIYGSIRICQSP